MVIVPPEWNIFEKNPLIDFGRIFALPAVNSKAADSPTILPTDRITPVIIPGREQGIRIVRIIYYLPAPSPIAP